MLYAGPEGARTYGHHCRVGTLAQRITVHPIHARSQKRTSAFGFACRFKVIRLPPWPSSIEQQFARVSIAGYGAWRINSVLGAWSVQASGLTKLLWVARAWLDSACIDVISARGDYATSSSASHRLDSRPFCLVYKCICVICASILYLCTSVSVPSLFPLYVQFSRVFAPALHSFHRSPCTDLIYLRVPLESVIVNKID